MGKRKSGTKSGKSVSKALKESPKRDDDEGTQTLAPSVSESSLSAPSPEPVEDDQSEDSVTGDSDEEDDQQVMDRDRCSIESTVLHTESIAVHAEIKKMKIEDIKCHQMDLVFQAGMYIQSKAMHKKEELELMIEKDYTNRVNKVSGKDIPVPLRRYGRSGELLYRERLLLSGTTKVKGRSLWREFEATKKQLRIHAGYSAEFTNAGTSGKTKQDRWNHLLRRHYQKVNLGDDKGFDPSTYRIKKYHTVFRKYGVIASFEPKWEDEHYQPDVTSDASAATPKGKSRKEQRVEEQQTLRDVRLAMKSDKRAESLMATAIAQNAEMEGMLFNTQLQVWKEKKQFLQEERREHDKDTEEYAEFTKMLKMHLETMPKDVPKVDYGCVRARLQGLQEPVKLEDIANHN